MATYKFYNIQAKPMNPQDGFIRRRGYKKVFSSLRNSVKKHMSQKKIRGLSYPLLNEMYLAPTSLYIRENYAVGELMKYDMVDGVYDTYEGTTKYIATGNESSKRFRFNFLFDFKTHTLAVECNSKLPSGTVIEKAFYAYLMPHLIEFYPEYYLDVIELKSAQSLDAVLEPKNRFKKVDVQVTYSNSQDWIDGMMECAEAIDEEMKENGIGSRQVIEKAEDKSTMSSPTKNTLGLLGLAPKFGNAHIRYVNAQGKDINYHLADNPIKLPVKTREKGVNRNPFAIFGDVMSKIKEANKLATESSSLLKRLRGLNE